MLATLLPEALWALRPKTTKTTTSKRQQSEGVPPDIGQSVSNVEVLLLKTITGFVLKASKFHSGSKFNKSVPVSHYIYYSFDYYIHYYTLYIIYVYMHMFIYMINLHI